MTLDPIAIESERLISSRRDRNLKNSAEDYPAILVIDDDVMNIIALECMIASEGHANDKATNGTDAIEQVRRRIELNQSAGIPMYRILFCDYSMPDLTGPEVTKIVLADLHKNNIRIPYICCCTAYSHQSFQQTALEAGMDQFMTKPMDQKRVAEICAKLQYND